ncbi:MAG: transporter, partial [Gammaproteobacteria bacterium]|nr:transporter [Gammaproteobacteria bacterium]
MKQSFINGSVVLILLAMSTNSYAAPITFNTALPIAKSEYVLREQIVLYESGNDPSGADRKRTAQVALSVLGYGFASRFAVFGVLPIQSKKLSGAPIDARERRSVSGIGDVTVFGRYTTYQRDRPGQTLRLAVVAGIKAPTGEDDEHDELGRLPPTLQLGSGSWDAHVGVIATRQTLDYQTDVELRYRQNREANNFDAGNEINLSGSLQYRLVPKTLVSGIDQFVYAVIEGNIMHRDNDRIGGARDLNSG